ncbi:MAG: dockerin type I repeat-containing protein, partial [Bacillota bacterium]|nr:dockerin type I repeat-containing protein [Bacillota bacterium]
MKQSQRKFWSVVLAVMLLVSMFTMLSASAASATITSGASTHEGQLLYGDTDLNGIVQIKDATLIQEHLAKMLKLSGNSLLTGNVNLSTVTSKSDGLDIKDVTIIQEYLAKMSYGSSPIGTWFAIATQPVTQPATQPTVAPTKTPTAAPTTLPTIAPTVAPTTVATTTVYFKDSLGWVGTASAAIYAYNSSTQQSIQMTAVNSIVWSAGIPSSWTTIDFYRCDPSVAFSTATAWNSWTSTGAMGTNNKFTITSDTAGTWGVYDSSTDIPLTGTTTLYFDNTVANWTGVYLFSFSGTQTVYPFTQIGTTGIWTADVPTAK